MESKDQAGIEVAREWIESKESAIGRWQRYPSTVAQAQALVGGCGAEVLVGSPSEVEASALEWCEAAARKEGWDGDWEPVEADCEYAQAQVILASAARGRL